MRPVDDRERRTLGVEGVWGDWVLERVERPCDCWRIWIGGKMRIKDVIAHLFDYHIMDKRDWTLEQLVAWAKTVEPKEAQLEDRPSLVIQRRESLSFELQRSRQEAEDWQAVRDAFETRRASRRKRELS